MIDTLAASFTAVRNNFKSWCDRVIAEDEALIVTRKADENVVILSAERFTELERAERNAAYLQKLERGIRQVEAGEGIVRSMAELEAMAADA